MPVCGVARQSGNFQAQHNAGLAHADVRNQFLETFTIGSRSPRLSQITIDNDNLLDSPTQGDRVVEAHTAVLRFQCSPIPVESSIAGQSFFSHSAEARTEDTACSTQNL